MREQKSQALLEARADIAKALAHPARLFIIEELSNGERCVGDLHALIGGDLSTVSKHLSVLKGAGLLKDSKRGTQVFYRLRVPCIVNFFTCIEAVLLADAEETAALLHEEPLTAERRR